MPAEWHYFTCILRNGEILKGTDDMPTLADKLNTKTFILQTRENVPIEVQVPEGYGLVLKKRVQFDVGPEANAPRYKYIFSFEKLAQERSGSFETHPPD